MNMRVLPRKGATPRSMPGSFLARRRLQTPDHRRAHRDHAPPALRVASIAAHAACGTSSYLAVHLMRVDIQRAHRRKGACADMQRDERAADLARLRCRKYRVIEVQAGGRRGDRAQCARIHCLIALLIAILRRAVNVRRQRDFSVRLEETLHVARELQDEEFLLAPQHFARCVRRRAAPRRLLSIPCWREHGRERCGP